MAAVGERVDRLEEALQGFITSVGIEFNKLYNSQMRTEAEMRAFSLAAEDSVIRYAEKKGLIVLATGDELMEVKNSPGFEPKPW